MKQARSITSVERAAIAAGRQLRGNAAVGTVNPPSLAKRATPNDAAH